MRQYIYEGFRDPIHKITGDAYRQLRGIWHRGNQSTEKQSQTKINYEWVDTVIETELEETSACYVAEMTGTTETTINKRARELGFEYDKDEHRWIRGAA